MWSHSHRGSKCLKCAVVPSTCHPWCHMFERAFVVSSCLSLSCFSPTSTFPLSLSTCSLSGTPSSMSSPPRVKTTALTHNEEYCSMAIYHPLTGYEPKLLDNFDYSETSAMIFQDESGDIDTVPSYSNYKSESNSATIGCSDTLRLAGSPVKSRRKVVETISCLAEGVHTIGLCVSWLPSEKAYFAGRREIGIESSRRQILQGHMAPRETSGKKGPTARSHVKVRTSRTQSVYAKFWGKNTARNLATRKMRPQRSMGFD